MHAYADRESSARDRAFERLYRRYVKDVYRYTLAVLRNPADAEDITQTTFLNAYRAFQRGEEPIKPQNWLIKIAHNACRTRYLRASRRPQEVPLDESLEHLSVPSDDIPDIKAVLDALANLPFNQRAAIVMRELEGRSYSEIAETLDVSVSAVETLIFRARRSLRVRHSALKALGALPLPASLTSFSGGTAAVGGALLGSSLLLKAILAVGVGIGVGIAGSNVEATVHPPAATVSAPAAPAIGVAPESAEVTGTSREVVSARPTPVAGREAWKVLKGSARAKGAGQGTVRVPGHDASTAAGALAPVRVAAQPAPQAGASESGAPAVVQGAGETVKKVVAAPAQVKPELPAASVPTPVSVAQAVAVAPVAPPLPPLPPLPPPPALP